MNNFDLYFVKGWMESALKMLEKREIGSYSEEIFIKSMKALYEKIENQTKGE
jgi:hypothetical protein